MSFKKLLFALVGVLAAFFTAGYFYYRPKVREPVVLVAFKNPSPHPPGWYFLDDRKGETRVAIGRKKGEISFYLSGNKILRWTQDEPGPEGVFYWGEIFKGTFHMSKPQDCGDHIQYQCELCEKKCALVYYYELTLTDASRR